MYLTSLVVRRDPGPEAGSDVVADRLEVAEALRAQLSVPPPEHHRLQMDDDAITVVCFIAALSGADAQSQIAAIRGGVESALTGLPGWSLGTDEMT